MAIAIERQIPERGTRGQVAAPAGDCCCCCCCCLHSLGGAIGAITTPTPLAVAETVPTSAINGATLDPEYSASGLYWRILLLLCVALAIATAVVSGATDAGAITAFWAAMLFPAMQLLASFIAVIVITSSTRVGQDQRLRHLGRITKRAFVGALIGGVLLAIGGVALL